MAPERNDRWRRIGNAAIPWTTGLYGAMVVVDLADRTSGGAAVVALVLTGLQVAALIRRGRHPLATLLVVAASAAAIQYMAPDTVLAPALLFALGSLAIARPPRRSIPGLLVASVASAVTITAIPAEDTVFAITLQVAVWSLGQAIRSTKAASREEALRAVAEERAHLEREVHDILAHSLSVMVVQAAAADDAFDVRPDAARDALRAIERQGRDALGEIRRLLAPPPPTAGTAHIAPAASSSEPGPTPVPATTAPSEPPSRSPQPGLADLPRLAERLAPAGAEVVIEHHGEAEPLPAGVGLSAYRIIQEATTNSVRHGKASRVTVALHHQPTGLTIRISDNGHPPARTTAGSGRGLVGMRERAHLHGGTLTAAPSPHGGYVVHAWLPAAVPVAV